MSGLYMTGHMSVASGEPKGFASSQRMGVACQYPTEAKDCAKPIRSLQNQPQPLWSMQRSMVQSFVITTFSGITLPSSLTNYISFGKFLQLYNGLVIAPTSYGCLRTKGYMRNA